MIYLNHISDHDFRSSNVRVDDIGSNLHVFDIICQDIFIPSQPIELEVKFNEVFLNDVIRYGSVSTIKLVSISRDAQKHVDLK